MESREKTIHNMCMTYRHDYGLTKPEGDPSNIGYALSAGMTQKEQLALYRQMEQIYQNDILPVLNQYMEEIIALRNQRDELKFKLDSLEK